MRFRALLVMLGVLAAWIGGLEAYLDVFTSTGDLFRTTNGTAWQHVASFGYSDGAAYVIADNGTGYFLTQSGLILRSQDQGHTWTPLVNYSVSDAVDLLRDSVNGYWFLLTASGDLYRGTDVQSMTPVANVGGTDCVGLVRERGGAASTGLVVVTRTGDVFRSTNHGTSWQRVGNVGMSDVVDLAADLDTLQVLTETGDLWRSTDHGASWTLWATVSQVGTRALLADRSGYLFLVDQTGALARFLSGSWTWLGTANQVFVQGMAAGGSPTLVQEDGSETPTQWRLFPNPSRGLFYLMAPANQIPETFEVWDALGRKITRGRITTQPPVLDLRSLAPGVYWVRCGPQRFRVVKY